MPASLAQHLIYVSADSTLSRQASQKVVLSFDNFGIKYAHPDGIAACAKPDVLVHESTYCRGVSGSDGLAIARSHSTAHMAGEAAAFLSARTLVLNHFSLRYGEGYLAGVSAQRRSVMLRNGGDVIEAAAGDGFNLARFIHKKSETVSDHVLEAAAAAGLLEASDLVSPNNAPGGGDASASKGSYNKFGHQGNGAYASAKNNTLDSSGAASNSEVTYIASKGVYMTEAQALQELEREIKTEALRNVKNTLSINTATTNSINAIVDGNVHAHARTEARVRSVTGAAASVREGDFLFDDNKDAAAATTDGSFDRILDSDPEGAANDTHSFTDSESESERSVLAQNFADWYSPRAAAYSAITTLNNTLLLKNIDIDATNAGNSNNNSKNAAGASMYGRHKQHRNRHSAPSQPNYASATTAHLVSTGDSVIDNYLLPPLSASPSTPPSLLLWSSLQQQQLHLQLQQASASRRQRRLNFDETDHRGSHHSLSLSRSLTLSRLGHSHKHGPLQRQSELEDRQLEQTHMSHMLQQQQNLLHQHQLMTHQHQQQQQQFQQHQLHQLANQSPSRSPSQAQRQSYSQSLTQSPALAPTQTPLESLLTSSLPLLRAHPRSPTFRFAYATAAAVSSRDGPYPLSRVLLEAVHREVPDPDPTLRRVFRFPAALVPPVTRDHEYGSVSANSASQKASDDDGLDDDIDEDVDPANSRSKNDRPTGGVQFVMAAHDLAIVRIGVHRRVTPTRTHHHTQGHHSTTAAAAAAAAAADAADAADVADASSCSTYPSLNTSENENNSISITAHDEASSINTATAGDSTQPIAKKKKQHQKKQQQALQLLWGTEAAVATAAAVTHAVNTYNNKHASKAADKRSERYAATDSSTAVGDGFSASAFDVPAAPAPIRGRAEAADGSGWLASVVAHTDLSKGVLNALATKEKSKKLLALKSPLSKGDDSSKGVDVSSSDAGPLLLSPLYILNAGPGEFAERFAVGNELILNATDINDTNKQ